MRRLGVAGLFLSLLLLPAGVHAQPDEDEDLDDVEALDDDEALDDAEDDAEAPAHPCAVAPPALDDDEGTTVLRTDVPSPVLTVALDTDVGDTTKACVWTGDPKAPFYSVDLTPCVEDFPQCRTITPKPLSIGHHALTVTVGDASPVRLSVERLSSDCSRRPVPAVLSGGDAETDFGEEEGDGGADAAVVLQGGSGSFRLTLPEPVALGEEPDACWWFAPPGLDGDVGHQWPIEPCEGEDPSAVTCVEVHAPAMLTPGRYPGAVTVGTGDPQQITLWVPPRLGLLWLATLAGFAVWVLVTIFLKGVVVLSRLERWKEHLHRRLEATRDDHKLLLARVWAALDFATDGLRRNKLRLAFNDLSPLEQHLREAEQLLTLSEKKMRIWDRVNAQLYPPTLVAQVVTELKLFDEVVLQYNYPLPEESGELSEEFPPLKRAEELLDAAVFDLDKNLYASLGLALGIDPNGGGGGYSQDMGMDMGLSDDDEDDEDDADLDGDGPSEEEEEDTKEPASEDDAPKSAIDIVRAARERELEHLHRLSPRINDALEFAPTLRLEVDLRLDVLRKLDRLLVRTELHEHLNAERLQQALDSWGRAELQDSFSHADHRRLHRDVIRWLVWRPENRRFAARLDDLRRAQQAILDETGGSPVAIAAAIAAGRVPLLVRSMNDEPWRTFTPRMLSVVLNDEFRDLSESFVWRRRIRVDWQGRGEQRDTILCMVTTERADADRVMQSGPTTVAFARTAGSYTVSPEVVLPEGVGETEGMRIPVAPLTVRVDPGTREVQNKRIQVYNGARTAISLLGSITAAVMLFEDWQQDPPLYVYWRALLVPIGIDLSTVALPAALTALGKVLQRRSSAPGALLGDDDEGGAADEGY